MIFEIIAGATLVFFALVWAYKLGFVHGQLDAYNDIKTVMEEK